MSIKSARQRLQRAKWAIEEMESIKEDKERHQWKFSTFLSDARDSLDHLQPTSKTKHECEDWPFERKVEYKKWYDNTVAVNFDSASDGNEVIEWLHKTNVHDKHYENVPAKHSDSVTPDKTVYSVSEVEPALYLGNDEEHAYHLENPPPGMEKLRMESVAQEIIECLENKVFDQIEHKFGDLL